ncbi:MAG: hypothetical protein OEQ53_12055 [Saprospiraceae bacterium]|nr:hypothetical protein [Saprospiraceae bacterium]
MTLYQHTTRSMGFFIGICLCLVLSQRPGWAQSAAEGERLSTLFDSLYNLSISEIQIHVDLDSLLAGRLTENEHKAEMKVKGDTGTTIELPLKISVRSKSRRRYCDFPPLKFDFPRDDLRAMGLRRQDDYKIVTHCLDSPAGEACLLKEYMTYKLYSIITPLSLRAKLVDMIYVDTKGENTVKQKAIILESNKEFAKKHDGKLCNCMGTSLDSIDAFLYEQMAMFQYMIGNVDMNYLVERNVKFVRQKPNHPMIPVAYDFDFSALVNAPYVYPNVKDNRFLKRSYLGFKENEAILEQVRNVFIERKEEILSYIENFEQIPKMERRACVLYVKKFFKQIEKSRLDLPYAKAD